MGKRERKKKKERTEKAVSFLKIMFAKERKKEKKLKMREKESCPNLSFFVCRTTK